MHACTDTQPIPLPPHDLKDDILRSSPFRTEPDLLREFEALLATPAGSGTKIFFWNVSEELNLRGNHDICVAAPPNAWPHETSLRSFLETLYYTDDDMPPAIKMIVKGSEVKPRNWTRFLCEQGTYTYRPSGGGMTAAPSPLATVCFGYQVPLGKLVEEFSHQHSLDHHGV